MHYDVKNKDDIYTGVYLTKEQSEKLEKCKDKKEEDEVWYTVSFQAKMSKGVIYNLKYETPTAKELRDNYLSIVNNVSIVKDFKAIKKQEKER